MKITPTSKSLSILLISFAAAGPAQSVTTTVNTGGAFNSGPSYTNSVNDTLIFNTPYIYLTNRFVNQGKKINNKSPLTINKNFENSGTFDVKQEVIIQGGTQHTLTNTPTGIINLTGPLTKGLFESR